MEKIACQVLKLVIFRKLVLSFDFECILRTGFIGVVPSHVTRNQLGSSQAVVATSGNGSVLQVFK